ncbi:hypothetical protein ADILRU_1032 [Leifsonia rubra CMS 76R]|nr:hypothetical protein ADILRU_1032 [Leifsonia rubra CMS 76R]
MTERLRAAIPSRKMSICVLCSPNGLTTTAPHTILTRVDADTTTHLSVKAT